MTTIVVQTRLAASLAKIIDQRATDANMTRAEVVRALLEEALAAPQPAPNAPATDPLLDRIADELGALAARVDAGMTASRNAYAAARLAALMLLPADRQAAFVEKLAGVAK